MLGLQAALKAIMRKYLCSTMSSSTVYRFTNPQINQSINQSTNHPINEPNQEKNEYTHPSKRNPRKNLVRFFAQFFKEVVPQQPGIACVGFENGVEGVADNGDQSHYKIDKHIADHLSLHTAVYSNLLCLPVDIKRKDQICEITYTGN